METSLVLQVGAVLLDAPDAVERDLQRKEDAGRGDEQHDDGDDLRSGVREGKQAHVAHDEVLIVGQEVRHHLADDIGHAGGVKDALREREQKNDEREEREDGLRGDGEGVGVDLGLGEVVAEGFELLPRAAAADGDGRSGGKLGRDGFFAGLLGERAPPGLRFHGRCGRWSQRFSAQNSFVPVYRVPIVRRRRARGLRLRPTRAAWARGLESPLLPMAMATLRCRRLRPVRSSGEPRKRAVEAGGRPSRQANRAMG